MQTGSERERERKRERERCVCVLQALLLPSRKKLQKSVVFFHLVPLLFVEECSQRWCYCEPLVHFLGELHGTFPIFNCCCCCCRRSASFGSNLPLLRKTRRSSTSSRRIRRRGAIMPWSPCLFVFFFLLFFVWFLCSSSKWRIICIAMSPVKDSGFAFCSTNAAACLENKQQQQLWDHEDWFRHF